jgi:hypothetical protein
MYTSELPTRKQAWVNMGLCNQQLGYFVMLGNEKLHFLPVQNGRKSEVFLSAITLATLVNAGQIDKDKLSKK